MNVLVTGGGTGGHVVPLLAVSAALKADGANVLVVGSHASADRKLVEAAGFRFQAISSGKLRRYVSWRNLTDPFRVIAGYRQARRIIKRFQPDVVFAKGGYVTLPVVWAASRARVPVVLHESDTVPGLANRRAASRASSIAVAFPPETLQGLPERKLVLTGNPLRDGVIKGSAARARKRFKLDAKLPTLLILCGSQGSTAINRLVWEALPDLLRDCQVVHQVGERNVGDLTAATADVPAELLDRYHPRGFFGEELFDLYAATDLVVARAGANGLGEIAATGLPAILIPLPSAAADHQRRNAAVFADRQAAVVLEEDELSGPTLNNVVKRLLKNQQRLAEMGRAARGLAQLDATRRVADLITQTGAHRG